MPEHRQFTVEHLTAQRPQNPQHHIFLGTLLQCALRALLIVFIAVTLLLEPPRSTKWICVIVLVAYLVAVMPWSVWALRAAGRSGTQTKKPVTLLLLGADITVVSILLILTGITSPEDWTSDVLRNGLFLIPLIAAAQLNPNISAAIAIPTVAAFLAASWITKSANQEPWASILLSAAILAGLAAGSVALSLIQRSKVEMIARLARQRTQLLEELVGLEKRERQAVAEHVHDGALQYVLVARQDLEDVRTGSVDAVDRVESALTETSKLLRGVVRELHPEVLARLGLKSAIAQLAASITARPDLSIEVDAQTWPDDERTDEDYVLYSAARETLTNAVKHAHAQKIHIELSRGAAMALLRITDDGVGISPAALTQSVENGHIGLTSIRTKILASGGRLDIGTDSPGTEITISIPLRQSIPNTDFVPEFS